MKKALASICPLLLICLMLTSTAFAASSREDLQARIDAAKLVLDRIMAATGQDHPLEHPGAGNLRGRGCLECSKRTHLSGGRAVRPGRGDLPHRARLECAGVFIRMAGGSFGFQIGGQATDLVLVAVNDRGFQDLLKNKFKIGGDASAAAGPVGRSGQAATDWKMNAELLSYSRSKGLFAGIDLDGTSVSQNSDDTECILLRPAAQL